MKQAVRRKHHYIYRIIRIDGSGRYYIGMHSTDNLEDDYFGSGSLLSRSIKKHGKDKHFKEILEHLPTREALKLREKEIVNGDLLGDVKCMNLQLGGGGGWTSNAWMAGHVAQRKLMQDPVYREKRLVQQRAASKLATKASMEKFPEGTFKNKCHSQASRDKMSLSIQGKQDGQKNSQFGTRWMSKDGKAIKVKKIDITYYEHQGFKLERRS